MGIFQTTEAEAAETGAAPVWPAHDDALSASVRRVACGASIAVALAAAANLADWAFGFGVAKSAVPGLISANPLASVALIIAGLAITLMHPRFSATTRRFAAVLASLVTLIGLVRLAGYAYWPFDIGLDRMLFASQIGSSRMAPTTASCLILLGASLLTVGSHTRRSLGVSQLSVVTVAVISSIAALGYAYRVRGLYEVAPSTPMHLQTAVSFLILSAAALLLQWGEGGMKVLASRTTGGVVARRLIPVCLLVPAGLGIVRMFGEKLGFWSGTDGVVMVVLFMTMMMLLLVWRTAHMLERFDLTRQSAEAELSKSKADAEAANALKSAFVANISHELRTPLTAIMGFTDLMAEPGRSEADRAESLVRVRRSARHLLTVINDLLDLSKIEAGKMHLEIVSCSPVAIVNEVAALLRPRAGEKGLALNVQLDGAVPQHICTDPTRLRQALLNLGSNAVKFTERGEVTIALAMATQTYEAEPMLRISVTDTGIGMTAEQVQRLFQPFTQADSSIARRFGGTGLGLSIAKHLAQLLGGALTVQSEAGRGSTFTLTLKTGSLIGVQLLNAQISMFTQHDSIEAAPAEPMRVEPLPVQSKATADAGPVARATLGGRVLIAEDNTDNQALISMHVKRTGATCQIAANGAIAVDAALEAQKQDKPFDLILMDMRMPVLDGCSATLRLRDAGYAKPIVGLTANASEEDRQRALNAGCNAFLAKPIDVPLLLATLSRHLPPAAPVQQTKAA